MRITPKNWTWIIGASAGIGESLCRLLATQNNPLIISARNEERLLEIAGEIKANSAAGCDVLPLDVSSQESLESAFAFLEQGSYSVRQIIYCPAIYSPNELGHTDVKIIQEVVRVNLVGAMVFTEYCLRYLQGRGPCQIAYCASVAGYCGLPSSQPYSASKAGLINYVESLRLDAPSELDIRLINSGFVRTRLTAKNSFKMPAIIEPEDAAKQIIQGLKGKSFEIHFPKRFTFFLKTLRLLPYSLYFRVIRYL